LLIRKLVLNSKILARHVNPVKIVPAATVIVVPAVMVVADAAKVVAPVAKAAETVIVAREEKVAAVNVQKAEKVVIQTTFLLSSRTTTKVKA
jgi:hypothetical protein